MSFQKIIIHLLFLNLLVSCVGLDPDTSELEFESGSNITPITPAPDTDPGDDSDHDDCDDDGDDNDDDDDDVVVEITFEDIKTKVIEPFGCIRCHGNWASDEAGLLTRITPGDPFSSPFYLRMEDGSMPFGGPSVDKDTLEYVETFIRGLKKNR